MGFNRRFAAAKERLAKGSITKTDFLESTLLLMSQGKVVPIISNSFRIEQIFREEEGTTEPIADTLQYDHSKDLTIEEQLTREWAESEDVDYPMPDKYNLARIAQYHLVETKDNVQARVDYINFLKRFLLASQEGEESVDLVNTLYKQIKELSFSEIVRQLDSPRFSEGVEDPLRLLARFPLPVYITTSYYNFLERALEAEGKNPRTQICFWSGGRSIAKTEHRPDPEFVPTPINPAVYHLFGLEDYPQTLVLSEDDYINFLISIAEDTNTQNPIVPLRLCESLADQRLLLLGFQLRDWDFRVLFRFILKFRNEISAPRGMVIQLKPDWKRIGDEEKSRKYLSDYFDRKAFHFEWTDTERFVRKLWDEWNKYRHSDA